MGVEGVEGVEGVFFLLHSKNMHVVGWPLLMRCR